MMSKSFTHRLLVVSIVLLMSLIMSSHAVDVFRVSQYNGGHQIWFEAEAFDDRDAQSKGDKTKGFQLGSDTNVKAPKGVSGDGIVVMAGSPQNWMIYTFDISKAGGKGGTWYLRQKMINPTNRSDWLWVLGDDGDKIPTVTPAFDAGDDRVFEGAPVTFVWDMRNGEGQVKELQDGENTMMVWWRESDSTRFLDILVWADDIAYHPTDEDYAKAKEIVIGAAVEPAGKLTTTWADIKQ
jgi:hypothetical protein